MGQEVWSLMGMLAAAAAILLLAHYVTKWVAMRSQLYHGTAGAGAGKMRVLYQTSVGRSERLVLLQLQKRCLLLGVTAGGISVLAELTEEEAEQWIGTQAPAPPSFVEAWKQSLSRKK